MVYKGCGTFKRCIDEGGSFMSDHFQLVSQFQPSGDQPTAIAQLKDGLEAGLAHQTLLGATGTGNKYQPELTAVEAFRCHIIYLS